MTCAVHAELLLHVKKQHAAVREEYKYLLNAFPQAVSTQMLHLQSGFWNGQKGLTCWYTAIWGFKAL